MFEYACTVERVIDGDTLDVTIDLGFKIYMRERVRLIGVDTPEVYGRNAGPEGQAAKAFVEAWVAQAPSFRIVSEKYDDRGKYGRVLARLFRPGDGISLNDALIAAGHVKA